MTSIYALIITTAFLAWVAYGVLKLTKEHRSKKAEKRLRAMMQEEVARSFSKKMSKLEKLEERRLKAVRRDVSEVEE